jgi:hypothetical protein
MHDRDHTLIVASAMVSVVPIAVWETCPAQTNAFDEPDLEVDETRWCRGESWRVALAPAAPSRSSDLLSPRRE